VTICRCLKFKTSAYALLLYGICSIILGGWVRVRHVNFGHYICTFQFHIYGYGCPFWIMHIWYIPAAAVIRVAVIFIHAAKKKKNILPIDNNIYHTPIEVGYFSLFRQQWCVSYTWLHTCTPIISKRIYHQHKWTIISLFLALTSCSWRLWGKEPKKSCLEFTFGPLHSVAQNKEALLHQNDIWRPQLLASIMNASIPQLHKWPERDAVWRFK